MRGYDISEHGILILYNRPKGPLESELGVLEEVESVSDSLRALGIGFEAVGVEGIEDSLRILKERPEKIVFNLVESFGRDNLGACLIPELCERTGKVCTGSPTPALIKTTDKVITKGILKANGIPTPNWQVLGPEGRLREDLEGKTLIIKPILSDGSEGIWADRCVIKPGEFEGPKSKALIHELMDSFPYGLMAEEFVGDSEVNIAVIEEGGRARTLGLAEIDFSLFPEGQPRIVDYLAKWDKSSFAYRNTPRVIPPRVSQNQREELSLMAIKLFYLFLCRDYIRVDTRIQGERFWVIDVNTNPDISPDAGFAATLSSSGWDFRDFIGKLAENASIRYANRHQIP